jgi:hypothetical protein
MVRMLWLRIVQAKGCIGRKLKTKIENLFSFIVSYLRLKVKDLWC